MSRRALALTIITCVLSGCTSWRVQGITPQRVIAERRPAAAFVQARNQSGVMLQAPFIRNDSLVGWAPSVGRTLGIPLAEVTQIEVRVPDGGKTAGLVVGIVAGIGLGLYLVVLDALNDPRS